jgi:AcrR family transcriptional regulator
MAGRQKVEVRREEILIATISEIERRGMSALRVSDVAARLGVSSGLVFYHFDTKDSLLVAALEFAVERDLRHLERNLARGRTPVERLRRVIASYGPTGTAQGWTLWIDAWTTALREPTIRQALHRLNDRWCSALEKAVTEGVEAGDFVCADPAGAVARIGSLIDGLAVASVVYQSVSRAQLRAWVRDAAAAELRVDPALLG